MPAAGGIKPEAPTQARRFQFWEAATGTPLREVRYTRPRATGSAFIPGGKLLLSCDADTGVQFWDSASGKRVREIGQELNYSAPVSLSPDGKTLALIGRKGQLSFHETTTGKLRRRLELDDPSHCLPQFAPDSRTLFTTHQDGFWLWDVATGAWQREIADCRGPVAFSPDGRLLACSDRKAIRLLRWPALEEVLRFDEHRDWIQALAFSADGKLLASALEQTIAVWDVASGKQVNHLPGHQGTVQCLSWTPDGKSVVSGSEHGAVACVWDAAACQVRRRFGDHQRGPLCAAVAPDGTLLATGDGCAREGPGSREATIRLWDLRDGCLVRQFPGHLNTVDTLVFSPDGKTLASRGGERRVRLWNVATGDQLGQVRNLAHDTWLAFAPDGRTLLIPGQRGEIAFWRSDMNERLGQLGALDEGRIAHLAAFLPGGKLIFSAETTRRRAEFQEFRIWDASSGELRRSCPMKYPARSGFTCYALSPDGKTLATSDGDWREPVIRLWDPHSGATLGQFRGHTRSITALAFSPDGKTLASGSGDTTVLLWDVPRAHLNGLWQQLAGSPEEAALAMKTLAGNPQGTVPFLAQLLRRAATQEAPYTRLITALEEDRFEVRENASHRLEAAGMEADLAVRLALEEELPAETRRRLQAVVEKLASAQTAEVMQRLKDLEEVRIEEAVRWLQSLGPAAEPGLRRALELYPWPSTPGPHDSLLRTRIILQRTLERLKDSTGAVMPLFPAAVVRAVSVLEQIGTADARKVLEELAAGEGGGVVKRQARLMLERRKQPHPGK
jgi:WD40 repeat protein